MKLTVLNMFAILILFASCDVSKKGTDTNSKEQSREMALNKETTTIKNIKWKLVSLMGKNASDGNAFIMFSNESDKVYGKGGCNNFNGTYQLKTGNQIKLSKIATTLMACANMEDESQFIEVLEMADNYSLNGKKMTLNKARMAPLAVFEVIETE